jgi:predicted GNAT family N-acyltransferase
MFEIRLATTQAELEELYRFRYSIYVEEMSRVQHDADHERKIISDKLDDSAHNLLVVKANQLVGAVRMNFIGEGAIPYYYDFYRIGEQFGVTADNVCIITRLMIANSMRKTALAFRICMSVYEFCLQRGIRYSFIDCNDHLVEFFKSFGWHYYTDEKTSVHKEYGKVHLLKFDLHNEDLFRQLNSPCLEPYLSWKSS